MFFLSFLRKVFFLPTVAFAIFLKPSAIGSQPAALRAAPTAFVLNFGRRPPDERPMAGG
jgi:hypothetical protein